MANIFYSSDHHMLHRNIIKFTDKNGNRLREFDNIEEHDEYIIAQHNAVVRPQDHAYFLGDFTFHKKNLHLVRRFNGHKRILLGNHDMEHVKDYLEAGFEKIMSLRVFVDEFVLTHVPIHPESVSSRWKANVHGHLHSNRVMKMIGVKGHEIKYSEKEVDPRYYSVCMEKLDDYKPIAHEDLKLKIKQQWADSNYTPPRKTSINKAD